MIQHVCKTKKKEIKSSCAVHMNHMCIEGSITVHTHVYIYIYALASLSLTHSNSISLLHIATHGFEVNEMSHAVHILLGSILKSSRLFHQGLLSDLASTTPC